MEKMNAITFAKTGHLLGVVTTASQADTATSVSRVAAGGFNVRGSDDNSRIVVNIPESEIGVTLVDYDTRVLYRPHLFALAEGKPEQQILSGPPTLEIALDGVNIIATLPVPVTAATDVWCQISGAGLAEPIVRSVTVPGSAALPVDTGTEALTLSAGVYHVVMFTPGYGLSVFASVL